MKSSFQTLVEDIAQLREEIADLASHYDHADDQAPEPMSDWCVEAQDALRRDDAVEAQEKLTKIDVLARTSGTAYRSIARRAGHIARLCKVAAG